MCCTLFLSYSILDELFLMATFGHKTRLMFYAALVTLTLLSAAAAVWMQRLHGIVLTCVIYLRSASRFCWWVVTFYFRCL